MIEPWRLNIWYGWKRVYLHVHWANGPHGSFKRIMRKVLPKYNPDALYPLVIRRMYMPVQPRTYVYTLEDRSMKNGPLAGFDRYFPSPPVSPNAEYLVQ